jgi:hypothetical protein
VHQAPVVLMLMLGVFAGNVVLASLMHWYVAVVETLKLPSPHRWRMAILGSLFNSGPWMLVTAGIFVYYESAVSWARWLGVGALFWFMFMGWVAYSVRLRNRGRRKNAA